MKNKKVVNDISKFQLKVHQSYREHSLLKSLLDSLTHKKDFYFWDYLSQFKALLTSDFIQFALEKEANAFLQEECYQLPLYFNSNRAKGWVVLNTPYFRFSTYNFDQKLVSQHRLANKGNNFSLQIAAQDQILYFSKSNNTELDIYEVAEASEQKPAGTGMKIKESLKVNSGDFIFVEAGRQALHFKTVIDDVTYHEISSAKSKVRVIGEYCLNTKSLIGVSAANLSSSRAEMFSEMVANFGYKPSIPTLKKLCAHTDHFVRWSAATSLYSLDNKERKEMIQQLTNDPHYDVKNTAKQCIEMLESA